MKLKVGLEIGFGRWNGGEGKFLNNEYNIGTPFCAMHWRVVGSKWVVFCCLTYMMLNVRGF